eukprot:scaffold7792_cov118-Isochrysis_galbana.AAC.1
MAVGLSELMRLKALGAMPLSVPAPSAIIRGGTEEALARRGVGRCGLPQHKGGGEARPWAGPYLPLPSGEVPSLRFPLTPRGVCVCNCLGFVSFPGPTQCVVGGCALFEWWGVAVVCGLCIVRGHIR